MTVPMDFPEIHRGSSIQQGSKSQPDQHRQTATMSRPVSVARSSVPSTPVRGQSNNNNGPSLSAGTPGSPVTGSVFHAAMPTPSIDDMEPQNVSFIETPSGAGSVADEGTDEADLRLPRRLRNLNITSGNRTYRIPHEATQSSPPRPALMKTFRGSPNSPNTGSGMMSSSPGSPPMLAPSGYLSARPHSSGSESPEDDGLMAEEGVKTAKLKDNIEADRGFIITFDDVAPGPKRPKPQLGAKRQPSPKKTSTTTAPPPIGSTGGGSSSSSSNYNTTTRHTGSSRVLSYFCCCCCLIALTLFGHGQEKI